MFWLGPAETIRTGVTGPFGCCRCVCWLTWVWFIVLLKPWVGQRPGGTEDTSTGASSLMTVKRRRDLSKHLSSLTSLPFFISASSFASQLQPRLGKTQSQASRWTSAPDLSAPFRWSLLGLGRYVVSFWGPNLWEIEGLFHSKAIALMKALNECKQWNVAKLHNCN